MPDGERPPPPEAVDAAREKLDDLRARLIDLTARNRFLNFPHRPRAQTQLRIVDELPDQVFERLTAGGKSFQLASLPEPPDAPTDEGAPAFLNALAVAQASDEDYLAALAALDDDDPDDPAAQETLRALKDRVRAHLGMEPWVHGKELSPAEWAKRNGLRPGYDLPLPGDFDAAEKHQDAKLQTLTFPNELTRRARKLIAAARTLREEKGVDSLYLALGFLEWRDGGRDGKAYLAPLLLLPAEISSRSTAAGPCFDVALGVGGVRDNEALAMKLKADFSLALPRFDAENGDEDNAVTPEAYFSAVEKMAAQKPGWRIRRYATFATFTFGALSVYRDLDPENWGEDGLAATPLIAGLLAGRPLNENDAEDVLEDRIDRPAPLVLDADSSQYGIVHAAAVAGEDLAVQGPPGTGKSQTIVNLIAAALGAGKKVLFVAEKAAALDVVKKRLADVGLGDFCLDLHGAGARREEVLAALRQRLEAPRPPADRERLGQALAQSKKLKTSLSAYAAAINRRFGRLGHTVHDLIWLEQATRAADLPKGADAVDVPDATEITPYQADETRSLLQRLADADAAFRARHDAPEKHPWRALGDAAPPPYERRQVVEAASAWLTALEAIHASDAAWRAAGADAPATLAGRNAAVAAVEATPPPSPAVDGALFVSLAAPEDRQALAAYLDRHRRREAANAALHAAFVDADVARAEDGLAPLAAALQAILGDRPVEDLKATAAARLAVAEQWEALAETARKFIAALELEAPGGSASVAALRRALAGAAVLREARPFTEAFRLEIAPNSDAAAAARDAAGRLAELHGARQTLKRRHAIRIDAWPDADAATADEDAIREAGWLAGWFDSRFKAARRRLATAGMRKFRKSPALAALAAARACRSEEAAFSIDPIFRMQLRAAFDGMASDGDGLTAAAAFGDSVRAAFPAQSPGDIAARQALFNAPQDRFAAMLAASRGDAYQTLAAAAEEIADADGETRLTALAAEARANLRHVESLDARAAELGVKPGTTAEEIAAAAEAQAVLAAEEPALAREARFGGLAPDVERLEATLRHADAVASALAGAPNLIAPAFANPNYGATHACLATAATAGKLGLDGERAARTALDGFGFDADRLFDASADEQSLEALTRAADAAVRAGEDGLNAWVVYRRDMAEAADAGLSALLALFREGERPLADLVVAYDRALYRSLIRAAIAAEPALDAHRGRKADDLQEQFRRIDREVMALQAAAIAHDLAAAAPPAGVSVGRVRDKTERALIEHYAAQKRPRIALRRLFAKAPGAIQALKPCLMLSPTTVAETLTPGAMRFDLLVIDEASQMKPEFAVGALARTRQAVIVGDEMQLPPTDFFGRVDADDEDDEDAEERVRHESILALANTAFRPERRLEWHYRSRHESLIAFSNQQFYEDRLTVFPAARNAEPGRLGVSLRMVEGARYTPGRRVNVDEAEAVVDEVLLRMRRAPERSLGVVAMNLTQRDLIEDLFNRQADGDDAVQAYLARWRAHGLDPFFVKNLESVQGDERDAILISGTFGPDVNSGKVHQNFGPLNGVNGHRRLNVLFTRARFETVMFASLAANDVRVAPDAKPGVAAYRDFLSYAATGRLPPKATGAPDDHESPFEYEVARLLARHGFETTPQVGVAGYRIDLGVRHASFPHGFIAGVECDGARYHSAAAARDRDRLRQEALERLGWTIIRVWSTDWFEDPAGETRRLVKALEAAARGAAPLLD